MTVSWFSLAGILSALSIGLLHVVSTTMDLYNQPTVTNHLYLVLIMFLHPLLQLWMSIWEECRCGINVTFREGCGTIYFSVYLDQLYVIVNFFLMRFERCRYCGLAAATSCVIPISQRAGGKKMQRQWHSLQNIPM